MPKVSDFTAALKPADIVFVADNSLISHYIRVKSGSFPYSHVCIADGEGGIWTTGADRKMSLKPPFFQNLYGRVDAAEFLAQKSNVAVMRYSNPYSIRFIWRPELWESPIYILKPEVSDGILKVCKGMVGENYPIGKLLKMITVGYKGEGVDCTDYCTLPDADIHTGKIRRICTESVAHSYLAGAGIELNTKAHNRNPSGYDLVELYYSEFLNVILSGKVEK